MDYTTFYNPNNNSSSSSTPILIPSSCTRRATTNSRNAKNNKGNNNNNNNKAAGGVKLSTDPQSVAARERRHRISDRFKMLQSLIPGGAKLDTVTMLEHAIQYVKFLKTQIWLHEALINNNTNNTNNNNTNNVTNNINSNDINNQDHKFIINTTSSTTINDDAYYYEQYCYALMYDCNNNIIGNQHEDDGAGGSVGAIEGGFDGGFCNPQEINIHGTMVAATNNNRAIQLSDGCSFHVHGQQSM